MAAPRQARGAAPRLSGPLSCTMRASMGSQGRRGRESPALHVLVGDERGRPGAAPGLARWVARVAPSRARGSVGIAMVSDARIRQLNQRFRGIDDVTDVLSFPSGPEPPASSL